MYLYKNTNALGATWRPLGEAPALAAVFTPAEKLSVQNLMDAEVHNENALTDNVFFGRHPSRKGATLAMSERVEWIRLRDQLVRVMLSGVTKAIPLRLCCLLGPDPDPAHPPTFLDPTNVGQHKTATEKLGILYTGRAGFVDLGHLRETCDLTEFVWTRLQGAGGIVGTVIPTIHGEATIKKEVPRTSFVDVAQAIANDDALGHEIITYGIAFRGGHNSSFSPEDLCSNFLGTLVARMAISTGGVFSRKVDVALAKVLKDLRVQTAAESQKAFDNIKKRWVHFVDVNSFNNVDYLQRRNFTRNPFKAGHPSDAATPSWVLSSLADAESFYDFKVTAVTPSILKTDFPAKIALIRVHAKSKYGPDFDKP